jgi:hypothetical protein
MKSSTTVANAAGLVGPKSVIVSRICRGECFDHFETIRLAKDGRHLNVSITISPIKDPTGRVIGVENDGTKNLAVLLALGLFNQDPPMLAIPLLYPGRRYPLGCNIAVPRPMENPTHRQDDIRLMTKPVHR